MNPSLSIDVRDLTVRLGGRAVLERVSFRLPEGAFLAVLGPNGAGKTTLFKCLLGLEPPDSGTVSVLGLPPGSVPPEAIGYVPQIKSLDRSFPARSVDLVMTGLSGRWPWRFGAKRKQEALQALALVGAETLAYQSMGGLSGGETQRVYLARSFARKPKLVLLDEPLAGVDVAGESDTYAILDRCQKETGATVAMITHDWETAHHHATYALILNRRLIGFGAAHSALTAERFREAFGHMGHEHPMCIPERGHD